MTALRPGLIFKKEPLDLSLEAGKTLLSLFAAAWLHLVFFISWEALAGLGLKNFPARPAAPPPLEIVLDMAPEIPAAGPPSEPPSEPIAAEEIFDLAAEAGPAQTLMRPEEAPAEETPGQASPPVTVESEAPRFKSYNTAVRGAVAANWLMPPEARANFQPGRLVVNCTVGRGGDLLRFVVNESTGSAVLDHAGLEALRAAAPFPPFPPELSAFSQLDITMIFDYQARYLSRVNARPSR